MPFCKEVLERRFLAEDLETINSIVDAKGDWSTKNKEIQQHLVEYQVHEWISQINLTNGVAPSYEDVFDKYKEVREKVGMDPPNYEEYRNRKKWVQRFMQKWKSTRGTLQIHEAENETEVKTKALLGTKKINKILSFVTPISGTDSVPECCPCCFC